MIRQPAELDETAKKFWQKHASRLIKSGLLHEGTAESFALLCRTHSELTRVDTSTDRIGVMKYVALNKLFQNLGRGFAMNSDKVKEAPQTGGTDEFGL